MSPCRVLRWKCHVQAPTTSTGQYPPVSDIRFAPPLPDNYAQRSFDHGPDSPGPRYGNFVVLGALDVLLSFSTLLFSPLTMGLASLIPVNGEPPSKLVLCLQRSPYDTPTIRVPWPILFTRAALCDR